MKYHSPWWHTITQNPTTLANFSCLALPATPLTLPCCVLYFGVFENLSEFCGKILCRREIYFLLLTKQRANTCNTVFSPTSSGFCSHPGPARNSTFPVALFFSYLGKFHFCCELTYVSFWEAFLNSERAFFGCEGRFFSLWCPQPLYKIYLYTYFNRGCFGNRALVFESNSLVVTQAKDCIVLCVSMTKSKSNLY